MKALVGVDIGGTKTAVVLGRLTGREPEILERQAFPTEHGRGPGPVVDRICSTARAMLASHSIAMEDLAGIGVSCGMSAYRMMTSLSTIGRSSTVA